jgi:quinol monooxygenase YgiN
METDMIKMKMELMVMRNREVQFLEAARSVLNQIRIEKGCLECRLSIDAANKHKITLVQHWRNEAAFAKHIRGRNFRVLLVSMDLLKEPPRITTEQQNNIRTYNSVQLLYDEMNRKYFSESVYKTIDTSPNAEVNPASTTSLEQKR